MAQKAKLIMTSGLEFDVQALDYKIERPMDKDSGKPSRVAKSGEITFTILVTKKDEFMFQQWIVGETEKDGKFFLPIVERTKLEEYVLHFKGAICTSLNVNFVSYGDKQMTMKITIHARELGFSGDKNAYTVKIENNDMWYVKPPKTEGGASAGASGT